MVELPDSLLERLKRRQTALVSGLGCSELAGAPGWAALVEWLAARLSTDADRTAAIKLVRAGRIADAVALVRAALAPGVLPDAIRRAYPDGAPLPDAVGLVAGLPWRAVVTTGFDDLWERALGADKDDRHPPHVVVGTDAEAPIRRNGHGGLLMHLFGRAALPESLCLGPGDTHRRFAPSKGLAWLEELRRERSLVLVGFRASDPDLDWLASGMSVASSNDVPHFLFLDVSRDADPVAEARLVALRTGMKVIPCPGGTAQAMDILAGLSTEIGAKVASYDADIDVDHWLARWAADPADPEPREVLARAAAGLRFEQEWDRLVELVLGRVEHQEDREEQLAALREVATIFRGPLAAPDRALKTGLVALAMAPADDQLWEDLNSDAAASGAWDELYREGTELARAAGPTLQGARIWREMARVASHHLDNPDAAVAAYLGALAADPRNVETRDELAELLRKLARWSDLVSVLRGGVAETKDPDRALKLLLESADVLDARLADASAAIVAFENVLALDPESQRAGIALERLYERCGRWSDLVTLLDNRASRSAPIDATTLRRRRAEIRADHLGETDAAVADLDALAAADPADRATLLLLDRITDRADRSEDQLAVLQRLVDTAAHDGERLTFLRRLATRWEQRPGGLDRAADALEHILRIEPRDRDAFGLLTRVYRKAHRPIALADVLARQIELTPADENRIPLHVGLAEVYDEDLDDPKKAYEAYAAAELLGDRREETYEAQVRLAERLRRPELCVEALKKWADVASEGEVRAEVLLQAGLLLADELHDRSAAESQLMRVLEIAPSHTGALTTLARICRDGGDYGRAVQLFLDAAEQVAEPTEKASLLTDAGMIAHDHLREENRAIELFSRALSVDVEYVRAAQRLADILFHLRRWAEVEPILDMLSRKVEAHAELGDVSRLADAARTASVQQRLGIAAAELGKQDKAAGCFATAYRLAPESLPILSGYANFRLRCGDWKQARDLYWSILHLHRANLPASEVLDITMHMGRCEGEQGETDAAIEWYVKVLALNAAHRPALEALCLLFAARGNWDAVVRYKGALKTLVAREEQAPLLEEIGELYFGKLHEVLQGVAAFEAALAAEPGRRSTLHKLLDLYTKEKDWRRAARTLIRLAENETDPEVRAKSLYAAALIRRDELGHLTEAADLFERTLDEWLDMAQAFEALERLHRDQSDWIGLGRMYRRMIRRLPIQGYSELRLRLWTQLGDLAVKRLHDHDVARAAFEVAAALEPANIRHQEMLADLYVQAGPSAHDKAIAVHQRLIAHNPNRLASYRALGKLYGETGDFDKQWCVAATLSFLRKADPDLEATYQRHRPTELRLATRRFSEEIWQRVRHPAEDRMLDPLFVLIGANLAAFAARPHAAVGLRRKRRVDAATDLHIPVQALVRIAETMDLPLPDVFLPEAEGTETAILNLQDKGIPTPALLLGMSTLRRRDDFELVFDLGKRMALMRPERFLATALGTPAALAAALRVALRLGGSAADSGDLDGEGARLVDYLRRTVTPQVIEQLALVAPKFTAARDDEIDFEQWIVATDLSAARAALLIAGDLWGAARVIASEPTSLTTVAVKDRLKDLIAFSVSEDYFICRRLLGLHLTRPDPQSPDLHPARVRETMGPP